jgi:hypothetical protein
MTCPICSANTEQITSAISAVNVVCPMCGEYEISSAVLATEQWQRLGLEERVDVLNKAKALAHPGAPPAITPSLIPADIEFIEQLCAASRGA